MGFYVNPPNESREEFLSREGTEVTLSKRLFTWEEVPSGKAPVILVDDVGTIAVNEKQLYELIRPDGRTKQLYLVDIEKLKRVTDGNFTNFMNRRLFSKKRTKAIFDATKKIVEDKFKGCDVRLENFFIQHAKVGYRVIVDPNSLEYKDVEVLVRLDQQGEIIETIVT